MCEILSTSGKVFWELEGLITQSSELLLTYPGIQRLQMKSDIAGHSMSVHSMRTTEGNRSSQERGSAQGI